MERLPPAPARASLPELRAGDTRALAVGVRLWRIYFRGGRYPQTWEQFRFYGPRPTGRFDHHIPPTRELQRGILYACPVLGIHSANPGLTCLAEVFQKTRTIDTHRDEPWLVAFALSGQIDLLDVTSGWTTRAGGNQALCRGECAVAREWSRAIYERYVDLQGLFYASSTFGPGRAVALTERAESALPDRPAFHRPLHDPALGGFLERAAVELGYELLE